jgi:hypothetical protein
MERKAAYVVFQGSIIFAVVASNIRWHWTPNGYLASILGFLAALLVTVGLSRLIEMAPDRFKDFWR